MTERFSEFLKLMRPRLSERGYRRHGSTFIHPGGEVNAKVYFQRTSTSSKDDPWLVVNWGLSVVSLQDADELTTFGNCMIRARLSNEHGESREFRLAAYPSTQAAADVIWNYLTPMLDYMTSVQTEADMLREIERGAPVLGRAERQIERLRFAPRRRVES